MEDILWEHFSKYGARIELTKDTVLNQNYDNPLSRYVYLLEDGICALTSITKQGEEKVYLYFHPRRIISFNQFVVSKEKKEKTTGPEFLIVTKTPCTMIQIPTDTFRNLLGGDAQFNSWLITTLADNYNDALVHFHLMQEESAVVRLCHLLLEIAQTRRGAKVVPRFFTYAELAKYLGCHPVTVSRIMAKLKKSGYISKSPAGILIEKETGLEDIINSESCFKY